jgi:hypothetical protein
MERMTDVKNAISKLHNLKQTDLSLISGGGDDKNEVKVNINANGKGGANGTIDYPHRFGNVSLGATYSTNGHNSSGGVTAGGKIGRNGEWSTQVTHGSNGLNIAATGKIQF